MDIYREYCRNRNKVKNMMNVFRKNKERDISFNAKTNNKAFWKYINPSPAVDLISRMRTKHTRAVNVISR